MELRDRKVEGRFGQKMRELPLPEPADLCDCPLELFGWVEAFAMATHYGCLA
jgi:hypothetical protein